MKTTLGCIRKADQDFHMIAHGDKIAVGVSGGKDSLLLLYALHLYRLFSHTEYTLHAFTMTLGIEPFDLTHVKELCDSLQIPYTVRETDIGHILFDVRKEKNPCALCAKIRRGILNDLAKEHGCNKLALAHHRDDALETLMMSLLFEGRIHTFHPVTYLSRSELTVIRPLVYLPEKHIRHMAKVLSLPVVKSPCPINGHTNRQEMKELLNCLARKYPRAPELMLSALQNEEQYGLWWKPEGSALGTPAKGI